MPETFNNLNLACYFYYPFPFDAGDKPTLVLLNKHFTTELKPQLSLLFHESF